MSAWHAASIINGLPIASGKGARHYSVGLAGNDRQFGASGRPLWGGDLGLCKIGVL